MDVNSEPLITPGALAKMIAPVKRRMIIGAMLSGVSSIFAILPFVAVAEVARLSLSGAQSGQIWLWVGIGSLGMILRTICYGGALMLCHIADVDFVWMLRRSIVRQLRLLPLGWFTESGSGRIKKIVADDVTRIHVIVAHMAGDLTSAIMLPIVSLIYLFWASIPLTLVLIAYVIIVFGIAAPSMRRGYKKYMSAWDLAQTEVSTSTVELVDGIEVVKTFGANAGLFERFFSAVTKLTRIGYLWNASMGRPAAIVNILFFPGTMVTVIMAIGLLGNNLGWIEPVGILPFLLVGVGLPSGYMMLAQMANGFRTAALGATSVDSLFSEATLPMSENPLEPESTDQQVANTIKFDDVSFSYTEEAQALEHFSLQLEPGTITALVGSSGSGKTTVTRLIPRFWDVTDGRITIGDVDVRDMSSADLLNRIAVVFQDAVVITDSVAENIRLGKPNATDQQIVAAAKAAQIHDRIMQLKSGYDTILGSEHGHLSGGELQRVTIARAFLQDAPILLLDEATAHADPDSEVAIQKALNILSQGRTVLVIAHRLSTVMFADRIVVLDSGRIVEEGTHEDLVLAQGRYRQLWDAQNASLVGAKGEQQ